jgi:hypothetical protein
LIEPGLTTAPFLPEHLLEDLGDRKEYEMLKRPDKDSLRAMLESQVQQKLLDDPDALTTYAAQRDPERKPTLANAQSRIRLLTKSWIRCEPMLKPE